MNQFFMDRLLAIRVRWLRAGSQSERSMLLSASLIGTGPYFGITRLGHSALLPSRAVALCGAVPKRSAVRRAKIVTYVADAGEGADRGKESARPARTRHGDCSPARSSLIPRDLRQHGRSLFAHVTKKRQTYKTYSTLRNHIIPTVGSTRIIDLNGCVNDRTVVGAAMNRKAAVTWCR
jgi:hypothetical protein